MGADPTATAEAVRLDGVTKRFGDTVALRDAWLKVQRGEFMSAGSA